METSSGLMKFNVVIACSLYLVLALKIGSLSRLGIHSTLKPEQTIRLFKSINVDTSLSALISIVNGQRLGLKQEYTLALQRSDSMVDEVALQLSKNTNYQQNHRIRNRLLGYHVLLYGSSGWIQKCVRNARNSIEYSFKPSNDLTWSAMLKSEAYSTPAQRKAAIEKAQFLCEHILFLVSTTNSAYEFDYIIESTLKIYLTFKSCFKNQDVPERKRFKETFLNFLWNLEGRLEQGFSHELRKIKAVVCQLDEAEIVPEYFRTKFCRDFVKLEDELMIVEERIFSDLDPVARGAGSELKQRQVEYAIRCQLSLIYVSALPHRISDDMLKDMTCRCMNGLMTEMTFVLSCQNLVENGHYDKAKRYSKFIFENGIDVPWLYLRLSKFIPELLEKGNPHRQAALKELIGQTRAYLSFDDNPNHSNYANSYASEMRAKVINELDELKSWPNQSTMIRVQRPWKRKKDLLKRMGKLVLFGIIIRCDFRPWYRTTSAMLSEAGLNEVELKQFFTCIVGLTVEVVKTAGFTAEDIIIQYFLD